MAVIGELIRVEGNGTLSFGDYLVDSKKKLQDFEVKGDVYYLKTHKEITRLEKNENLLFEAVPGATVHNFKMTEEEINFKIEGVENTQITMELESSTPYVVRVDGGTIGEVKTTMSGKLVFSADLTSKPVAVQIKKA